MSARRRKRRKSILNSSRLNSSRICDPEDLDDSEFSDGGDDQDGDDGGGDGLPAGDEEEDELPLFLQCRLAICTGDSNLYIWSPQQCCIAEVPHRPEEGDRVKIESLQNKKSSARSLRPKLQEDSQPRLKHLAWNPKHPSVLLQDSRFWSCCFLVEDVD